MKHRPPAWCERAHFVASFNVFHVKHAASGGKGGGVCGSRGVVRARHVWSEARVGALLVDSGAWRLRERSMGAAIAKACARWSNTVGVRESSMLDACAGRAGRVLEAVYARRCFARRLVTASELLRSSFKMAQYI